MPITYQHEVDPRIQAFLTYAGALAAQDQANHGMQAQFQAQADRDASAALAGGIASIGQGIGQGLQFGLNNRVQRENREDEQAFRQGLQQSGQAFEEAMQANHFYQQQEIERYRQTGQFTDDIAGSLLATQGAADGLIVTDPELGISTLLQVPETGPIAPSMPDPTPQEQALLNMPGQPFKRDFTKQGLMEVAQINNALDKIETDPSIPDYAKQQARQNAAIRMQQIRPRVMLNNEKPPPTFQQLQQAGMVTDYGGKTWVPRFDPKTGSVVTWSGEDSGAGTATDEQLIQKRVNQIVEEAQKQGYSVTFEEAQKQANDEHFRANTRPAEGGYWVKNRDAQGNTEWKFQKTTPDGFDAAKLIPALMKPDKYGDMPTATELEQSLTQAQEISEKFQQRELITRRIQTDIESMESAINSGEYNPTFAARDLKNIDSMAASLLQAYPDGELPPSVADLVRKLGAMKQVLSQQTANQLQVGN